MRRPKLSLWFLSLVLLLVAVSLVLITLPANAQGDHSCVVASLSIVRCDDTNGCYCQGADTLASCGQCAATYVGGYTICTSDSNGRRVCTDYQN
jgi:hypothetical protein